LGLAGDVEARYLIRQALRDSEPAAKRFGWCLLSLCELPPDDNDVGYTAEDGTIFVKVRDPTAMEGKRRFYSYSFVLATVVHELVHLTHLGHGKTFYRCLSAALSACGIEAGVRREARAHVCAELLNAVCDNDARRARALLAVMPEAAVCRRPGAKSSQMPLEYAAHHGRVALTKLLLEARADPALCSATGTTLGVAPVARAAAQGNAKTVALLLAARADVVEVPSQGQSVLAKAIAAAKAGSFAEKLAKGEERWKMAKLLADDCGAQIEPTPSGDPPQHHDRSTVTRRRRRRRPSCPDDHGAADRLVKLGSRPKRAMSMPSLPTVPVLPSLAGPEVRRPMARSALAGSLAL